MHVRNIASFYTSISTVACLVCTGSLSLALELNLSTIGLFISRASTWTNPLKPKPFNWYHGTPASSIINAINALADRIELPCERPMHGPHPYPINGKLRKTQGARTDGLCLVEVFTPGQVGSPRKYGIMIHAHSRHRFLRRTAEKTNRVRNRGLSSSYIIKDQRKPTLWSALPRKSKIMLVKSYHIEFNSRYEGVFISMLAVYFV